MGNARVGEGESQECEIELRESAGMKDYAALRSLFEIVSL